MTMTFLRLTWLSRRNFGNVFVRMSFRVIKKLFNTPLILHVRFDNFIIDHAISAATKSMHKCGLRGTRTSLLKFDISMNREMKKRTLVS